MQFRITLLCCALSVLFTGVSAAFIPELPSFIWDNVDRLREHFFNEQHDYDSTTWSLFPSTKGVKSWTTSSTQRPPAGTCTVLTLSNDIFRLKKDMTVNPHPIVNNPADGKKAMRATYAKGTYTLQHGSPAGFSFYAPGPTQVDLTKAKEVTFGYKVFFPAGFNFVKGGKLPGLYGGNTEDEAVSCSGGRRDTGCFSVRFMWRAKGAGELYTYLPDWSANDKLCTVKPFSECNPTYGASVGRGAFTFATGAWTSIVQRVRLNNASNEDGELELWANGKSVIKVTGLKLRDNTKNLIRGMQFQTFFGGSTVDFATPKDQQVYFSDFAVSITQLL